MYAAGGGFFNMLTEEERFIDEQLDCVYRWYTNRFRDEWYDFCRLMQQKRQQLIHEKGFTAEKTMVHVAEIPVPVNNLLMRLPAHMGFGPEWMNNRPVLKKVLEKFSGCRVNETTVPEKVCVEKFERTRDLE